jgi:hypothetical protein
MCWMKYYSHTLIKGIQSWIKQDTTKKWDHEFVDSEMIRLLSRVCALCEEEGHAIMDCHFVFFSHYSKYC